jgi:hypothetical protein
VYGKVFSFVPMEKSGGKYHMTDAQRLNIIIEYKKATCTSKKKRIALVVRETGHSNRAVT